MITHTHVDRLQLKRHCHPDHEHARRTEYVHGAGQADSQATRRRNPLHARPLSAATQQRHGQNGRRVVQEEGQCEGCLCRGISAGQRGGTFAMLDDSTGRGWVFFLPSPSCIKVRQCAVRQLVDQISGRARSCSILHTEPGTVLSDR